MKEKIIKTLESELDTAWDVNGHLVYVIYEDDISDVAENIEQIVNQEVEKRIAERQLTDEQIRIEFPIGGTFKMKYNQEYAEQIKENQAKRLGAFWYRSRLTNPGVNDSQKTEGGGE